MAVTDPIADMLTRIRNAIMVRHDSVVMPASKTKLAIARILKDEGFITDFDTVKEKNARSVRIRLRYYDKNDAALSKMERVSKPGLRVYVGKTEIPRVASGMGIAILSTSKGVMTGQQAWRQGIGGEFLCYVV